VCEDLHADGQKRAYTGLRMMDRLHHDVRWRLQAMGLGTERIMPVAVPLYYRLELSLGALLASIFVLVYLALIPSIVWGLYRLTSTTGFMLGIGPRPYSLAVVLLLGCLLIISLVRPLIARPGRVDQPHFLKPEQQPLLFSFVEELAVAGGMPMPSDIAVDCSVNSCHVRAGGVAGLFRSEFTLVVGLPLVASLRLDQLAGVLAHELGHAAQAAAMWPSRFITSMNAWFSRVACEPDELDERIRTRCETAHPAVRLALRFAEVLFRPARVVLRLLMWAESAATSVFLRRMELEADGYQIHIAGTDAFVSTVRELNLLAIAAQRAVVELSHMWRKGQLVDDYPRLIAALRGGYSKGFVRTLLAGLEEGRTGIFSGHPCDRDRVALARKKQAEGILATRLPASALFVDYEELCREVTFEFYDQELHLQRQGCELLPVPRVLNDRE
jgi:Zn-dependent protease with chaperone function